MTDTTTAAARELAEKIKEAAREHTGAVWGDAGVDRCAATWDAFVAAIDQLAALALPAAQGQEARKPLKDVWLRERVADYDDCKTMQDCIGFARTIEEAHGIGSSPKESGNG